VIIVSRFKCFRWRSIIYWYWKNNNSSTKKRIKCSKL